MIGRGRCAALSWARLASVMRGNAARCCSKVALVEPASDALQNRIRTESKLITIKHALQLQPSDELITIKVSVC